jgi:mono/diheme cytochrome c family protein
MKANLAPLHVTALLALAGACLLAFGASVAFAQHARSRHDEPVDVVLARVPEKARVKRNPFESDPEAAVAGKKLFEQHCAECHGEAADGAKRGPSLRVGQLQQATAGEIFWILTNGVVRHGMPAWSKLPEPQRWQIIAFLRAVVKPGPREVDREILKSWQCRRRAFVHAAGRPPHCPGGERRNTAWILTGKSFKAPSSVPSLSRLSSFYRRERAPELWSRLW